MSHSVVSVRYKYAVVGDVSQREDKREIEVHGHGRYESEKR